MKILGLTESNPHDNKDGHPDCKQIVFGLNVTADGYVPISYTAYDGNTSDGETHIPNWNQLRELLCKEDFIYIADSKACEIKNIEHITGHGGKLITIMPASRKEVKNFHDRLKNEKIPWKKGYKQENSRKTGEITTYQVYEDSSREGHRIVWVHSDTKAQIDANRRQPRIAYASKKLSALVPKLNRYKLKNREKIQQAVNTAIGEANNYITYEISEPTIIQQKQIGRGKPSVNTRYLDETQTTYQLKWQINKQAIREANCTDGIFPLMDNTKLDAVEVLKIYKQQPYLEKRHSTLKTVEGISPIYLKKTQRIEAMLFLFFAALMIISLVERNIRRSLQQQTLVEGLEPVICPLSEALSKPEVLGNLESTKPFNHKNGYENLNPLALPERNQDSEAEPQNTVSSNILPLNPPFALPILPQGMKTKTPTWKNLKYFFRNVYQVIIIEESMILKPILKGMTSLHVKILELLGVPASVYDNLYGAWWRFQEG